MSHHSEKPYVIDQGLADNLEVFFKRGADIQENVNAMMEKLTEKDRQADEDIGPTGDYPDGMLGADDKGGTQFKIGHIKGRVFFDFGRPVRWLGLTANEAIDIANAVKKHAKEARRQQAIIESEG